MFSAGTPATPLRAAAGFRRAGAARDGTAGVFGGSAGAARGASATTSSAALSSRRPLNEAWRSKPSVVQRPELDFGDELQA